MLPDLCGLINKHWDDKGDVGTMARIVQMLYEGYPLPGKGYYNRGVYTTLDGEIQKMISESKKNKK